eukprot:COSAG06_NODE_50718_length_316_cov_1.976959_1_plen_33_part_10
MFFLVKFLSTGSYDKTTICPDRLRTTNVRKLNT